MTHIDICNLPENSCCGNCDLHREAIELLVSQARQEEREALKKLVEGEKWVNRADPNTVDEAMFRQEQRETEEHNRSLDRIIAALSDVKEKINKV